ncbi:MAG TPA: hypothetical protein VFR12_00865 [Pyrinomonadaceae bacterium]|nr:hypothetical protein [Pyrinomonadaceae bacterium]
MIPLHKCLPKLLLAAILLSASTQTASAAPSFATQDQLKFTYPLPDDTINTLSFILLATEGEISGAEVKVREVKTADGELRPLEAITAALEATTVTTKGVKVSLTLDPRFFTTPGEYRVLLYFQGANGTPTLTTPITISRLAADINLDELKDQTVALTRPFPFWPASSDFLFHLRENSRRVALKDLKVTGQGLYLKDTKELVPGAVTAAPWPSDPSGTINVPAGGEKQLKVTLSNLRRAGAFDTRLVVTSPSFAGEKVIPIKVTVRDFILFPLLAIALGVCGGYFTRQLVAVERPRNQNAVQLVRLQKEIERFREVVTKPASLATINTLLAQLRTASESNETGDFAAVRAELPKIQEKLDEFRKAQVEAQEAANTTRAGLVNQIEALERETLTADESRELLSVKGNVADLERLLRQGMVEDAQTKLENVQERLADLKKRKLTNYFALCKAESAKLPLSADDAATDKNFEKEIQQLLNSNELDKVRAKLEEFRNFIEVKKIENLPRGARESEDELEGALPDVPSVPSPETVVTRIVVTTPIEERIAGTTVLFRIDDAEQIVNSADRLRWFFGDVGSEETQSLDISHRYEESGRYQVRVEISRNGTAAKTLSEFIDVSPGKIEQARAGVLRDIARNELILSIIALVLAVISGVLFLYVGKLFGTLVDYLMAILWGFGIDNSIKGFAAVLGKISSNEG